MQSARSVEFWILFVALTLSSGAATTLVNNQDVVAAASGASDAASSAALVSLFSVCNCVGRLVEGLCSDAISRAGAPRPATLMVAQVRPLRTFYTRPSHRFQHLIAWVGPFQLTGARFVYGMARSRSWPSASPSCARRRRRGGCSRRWRSTGSRSGRTGACVRAFFNRTFVHVSENRRQTDRATRFSPLII
jgi:hypothetical protein